MRRAPAAAAVPAPDLPRKALQRPHQAPERTPRPAARHRVTWFAGSAGLRGLRRSVAVACEVSTPRRPRAASTATRAGHGIQNARQQLTALATCWLLQRPRTAWCRVRRAAAVLRERACPQPSSGDSRGGRRCVLSQTEFSDTQFFLDCTARTRSCLAHACAVCWASGACLIPLSRFARLRRDWKSSG